MGDEKSFASGGFVFRAGGDGEWENLGYVSEDGISLSTDSDELEVWQGKLLDLNQTATIALKPEWWSLNKLYKLIAGRYIYTVTSLRKERKGRKGRGSCRAAR